MKRVIFGTVLVLFLFSLVNAQDFTYVGYKKCMMCHKGERKGNVYETWLSKKHAKAFDAVKEKGQEKNPKCMECHATGFNEGGYKIGDPNASKFEGVQCEACHGPGSVYKKTSMMKNRELALKNGMKNITEKTCLKCHDDQKCDHSKKLNYQEALKQIDHTYSKK